MMMWLVLCAAGAADLYVKCVEGCLPSGDDKTPNVMLLPDEPTDVTLEWSTSELPTAGDETIVLRAGNSNQSIPDLGPLTFEDVDGRWVAKHTFPASSLGQGTFLAVVIGTRKSKQRLLDWRSYRLLREGERLREIEGVRPATQYDITLAPAVLRAQTARRGPLPRGGGDRAAWWSLVDEDTTANLDLDGDSTGLPGLNITVDDVWEAGVDGNWMTAIRDKLSGGRGRRVRFEDLEFVEHLPELYHRKANDGSELEVRYYYGAVTLSTSADVGRFETSETLSKRRGEGPQYSHETSATLREPFDPRLWASYDIREFGADLDLLELLGKTVKKGQSVPGLPPLATVDGDGGDATYHVGFVVTAKLEPAADDATQSVRPTVLAVDVVARRAGIGGVRTDGSASDSDGALARWLKPDTGLDLDDPPPGWRAYTALAQPATTTSTLRILGKPDLAQRGAMAEVWDAALGAPRSSQPPVRAPVDWGRTERVRFALSAKLRAGALVRQKVFQGDVNLIPINAFTQYVLRFAVVVPTGAQLASKPDRGISARQDQDIHANVPKANRWRLFNGWGGAVVILLCGVVAVALLVLLPGVRSFINRSFRL
ncbi:MAG: hypothetical protein AAGA48_38140 [Myxococcota bacterium]